MGLRKIQDINKDHYGLFAKLISAQGRRKHKVVASPWLFYILLFVFSCNSFKRLSQSSYLEIDGMVVVEAEGFHSQEKASIRKWYRVTESDNLNLPDPDGNHASSASGGAYLEILPDTRTNHDEKIIPGENFSNQPGELGVLNYRVNFSNPGKYYVWVRAYSTGTEDNGIHVGIDGNWVESGQRMQWCHGKNTWTWGSKQRTKEVHCGVERQIFLNILSAGLHTISFSMREDGFEFDKWVLSKIYNVPE